MSEQLRVLLVEDSDEDAQLLLRALKKGGFEVAMDRVETELDFRAALADAQWDIVISDYVLPSFSGPEALRVLKDAGVDVPLIMLSGRVGEDLARDELMGGAADFIPKSNLTRLVPAIRREMKAAEGRHTLLATKTEIRRLEDSAVEKNRFFGAAVHEVKNPMTPMKIQLAMMRAEKFGPLNAKQRHSLEIMDRGMQRMEALAGDLLDAARLCGAGLKLEPRVFDVSMILEESVANIGAVAEAAGQTIQLEAQGPIPAYGDVKRTTQIISNLLANATKFTPRGGRLMIRGKSEGRYAVVRVSDTGIGFTSEDAGRLFAPFMRLQRQGATAPPGTGLGLFLCRQLVTLQGGRISASSPGPGRGATFTVELPSKPGPIVSDPLESIEPMMVEPVIVRVLPQERK